MAYDYQIRPALHQAGYSDADIGWDQGRQTVTLKGQDFIGRDNLTNVSGSTFTDRQSFDNALKKYNQGQQTQQLQSAVTNYQMPTNPYTQQLDDQIKYLMSFAQQNQKPVDPYSTAQYAAYKGQSDRRAHEGTRAAQEALGTAGFGRSTTLGERAQGIQNDENAYLETQIIPQILAAEEAKRQQQFSNLSSLLNPLMSQQSYADNRSQTERGNAYDALSMLLGEDQRGIDNSRNQQLDNRAILESDRAYEYQQGRDSILDERDKRDFDENVRRYGLDYALQKAETYNQIANRNAQTALDRDRLTLQRDEFDLRAKEAEARTKEENETIYREESQALAEVLRSGEMTPADAIKQIDEDLSFGFYTKEQADRLKEIARSLAPSLPSATKRELTDEEQVNMPTDKELDKLYKEHGNGKPLYEWKEWYRSPQGRMGGVDFDTWKSLYGPTLRAK